jgi:hypothetical protein
MKKRIMAAVFALCFIAGTASVGFAAKLKCTVDSVDGDKVTMTCAKADKLKAGDKVKVSPPKKGAAVEGC